MEHLKIETRLIDERFASVMGECEVMTLKVCRVYLELCVKLKTWKEYCRILTEDCEDILKVVY